ncbi:MAG: hypothetical protein M1822_009640 [Bathelium mastoideum]|nr:MAG: hypothetical protein M1822_009640 [Bathelium mastoideum]
MCTSWIELPLSTFFEPEIPGKTHLTSPSYSFLITHRPSNRKVLFDLGVRKDWTNMAPRVVKHIQNSGWTVSISHNVADILTTHNVPLDDIEAIVWSHQHWDHIGDPSTFPTSTALVVGPGFPANFTPGYPTNLDARLRDSDFAGRALREITFSETPKLGRFRAHDYFGDGSFYLLDTPGHTLGHLCGLARTTPSPDATFMLMAGDACHLGAEFRPSRYRPLPRELHAAQLPAGTHAALTVGSGMSVCPGALFQEHHPDPDPHAAATAPFYLPNDVISHDVDLAKWTIAGLQEFDAAEEVFVVLAHDEQLLGVVDMFPATADEWKEKGYAEMARWRFLGDFGDAVGGKRGEEGKANGGDGGKL